MSTCDDVADELRIVRGRHPEEEERRASAEVVEQVEQRMHLGRERRTRAVPIRKPKPAMHQLVPILEVDAQQKPRPLVHDRTVLAATSESSRRQPCPCPRLSLGTARRLR